MKKLLITTMAAVSVGLCAKADLTAETFETYGEGSLFGTLPGDSSKYEISDGWETETTLENLFTVTNIANYVGAGTYPQNAADRPSKSDSVKALAIDTSAPLLRYADSTEGSQSLSDAPIFFDSVVQFTATDVAGEHSANDKLRVWLYKSPDDVSETNPGLFKETATKKTLVITAGVLETNNGVQSIVKKDYDTGKEIEPDSWHRLTIKSFIESDENSSYYGRLVFNVWVDAQPVSVDGVKDFLSLVDAQKDKKLQGVAFDGKGAVDDIVFTTTDPFYVPPVEVADAKLNITFNDFSAIDIEGAGVWYDVGTESVDIKGALTEATLKAGDKVSVWFGLLEGYELVSPEVEPDKDGYYVITIDELTADGATIAIVTKEPVVSGGVTVGGTTVEIGEDGKIANITTAFDGKAVSGELDTTKFKSYYTAEVKDGILNIKLDQKAAAPFAEATEEKEVLEVGEDDSGNPELTVRIKPYVGLYYGAMTGSALDNLTLTSEYQKATTDEVIEFTATGKAGDTAGFIKVVVTDIAPEE